MIWLKFLIEKLTGFGWAGNNHIASTKGCLKIITESTKKPKTTSKHILNELGIENQKIIQNRKEIKSQWYFYMSKI